MDGVKILNWRQITRSVTVDATISNPDPQTKFAEAFALIVDNNTDLNNFQIIGITRNMVYGTDSMGAAIYVYSVTVDYSNQ